MYSIPMVHWSQKSKGLHSFEDFNVVAEENTFKELDTILQKMNVNSHSKNQLKVQKFDDLERNQEEYTIRIKENEITLISPSYDGLYHGLSTLRLLLFTNANAIQGGVISDCPMFKNRGVFLDVSRGKMPTLPYLKDLVTFISDLKYNTLQLYFEDKYCTAADPEIGRLSGCYCKKDIMELDAWCRLHRVELQPCIQTYSHFHGILTLPEYSHLAENENLFSLAAGNEMVYELIDRIFGEVLSWFSSTTVHVNMDEAYDLGTGYTKKIAEKYGKGYVYFEHIRRVGRIAEKYGAEKIIIWGDIALKYKEYLNRLPQSIVVTDWNYNPLTEFETLDTLKSYEGEYWAAGGVSTWNTLFPRIDNSYVNLINYSTQSYDAGANGFLITDWGDYGHFQPLGLSLYGYMIGAQQCYHASKIQRETIEENAWPLIFKDNRLSRAFELLMQTNLISHMQTDFKSMSIYYFFDDLFDGLTMRGNERYPKLAEQSFVELLQKSSEATEILEQVLEDHSGEIVHLDDAWDRLFGLPFIEELAFSSKAMEFTAKKGLLSYKIKRAFMSSEIKPPDILQFILEIKERYSEFLLLRNEFERIWQLRATRQGIENSLLIFDKAGVQLGLAVQWLSSQYRTFRVDNVLDRNMDSYLHGENYKILWTVDYKDMWDKAYPWK